MRRRMGTNNTNNNTTKSKARDTSDSTSPAPFLRLLFLLCWLLLAQRSDAPPPLLQTLSRTRPSARSLSAHLSRFLAFFFFSSLIAHSVNLCYISFQSPPRRRRACEHQPEAAALAPLWEARLWISGAQGSWAPRLLILPRIVDLAGCVAHPMAAAFARKQPFLPVISSAWAGGRVRVVRCRLALCMCARASCALLLCGCGPAGEQCLSAPALAGSPTPPRPSRAGSRSWWIGAACAAWIDLAHKRIPAVLALRVLDRGRSRVLVSRPSAHPALCLHPLRRWHRCPHHLRHRLGAHWLLPVPASRWHPTSTVCSASLT